MKKLDIKGRKFKIIPEAGIVQGEKEENWIGKDLKRGIKPVYKSIINEIAFAIDRTHTFNAYGWPGESKPKIYATAYCDKNDEFDEKIGIEVCSAKLDLKNHRKLAKFYDRMHRILIETATIVGKMCIEHDQKAQAIEADLEKTYGRLSV